MKMNINFQVTGNDRKKVATYTILFPQFQKHKISLIMMSWFYLQSSLKREKKRTTKTNGTAVLKKKFWSVT